MTKYLLTSLLFSSLANASSFIECGSGSYQEGTGYQVEELALSSQSDDYNGPVGGEWIIRFAGGEWIEEGKINAVSNQKDELTSVEIKVVVTQAIGGPVGTRYVLSDKDSESPVLERYTMGGFVGNVLTGIFTCAAHFESR